MAKFNESVFRTHGPLLLFTTPEKFYIHPENDTNELLVIDRVSHNILLEPNNCQLMAESISGRRIMGLIGIINLLAGPHLIIISQAGEIGQIMDQPVYRIEEIDLLPFTRNTLHLTEEQANANTIYVSMIKSVLSTPEFYFSYSLDISHTLQRLSRADPEFSKRSLFERSDSRFVWNQYAMQPLLSKPELSRYWLPIILGFITIKSITINRKVFSYIIISRRSINRAGTRLFTRGADNQGNVANFVETEQIVEFEGNRSSFTQVRGSIPLIWSQMPNLKYRPPPTVLPNFNQAEVMQKHIDSLIDQYSKVTLISLIDSKPPESSISEKYREVFNSISPRNARYQYFDFHHECSKMRWHRLSILMEQIAHDQRQYGYFLCLSDGRVSSTQEGVFRSNCIDSLDRTNVVQSMIAKISLEEQLKKFNILFVGEKIEDHSFLYNVFRNAWADNADTCSIQYSGTGALKTDFTRTGKRSQMGLLQDGLNSMIRYYKNNFADGFRQDSIDLFLGKYVVTEEEGRSYPCPLSSKKDNRYFFLPLFLLGSAAMFFCSLFLRNEFDTETFAFLLFWAGMVAGCCIVIGYYGSEFVDFPKLCPLRPNAIDN